MNTLSTIVLAAIIATISSAPTQDRNATWLTKAPIVNREHKSDRGVFKVAPVQDHCPVVYGIIGDPNFRRCFS